MNEIIFLNSYFEKRVSLNYELILDCISPITNSFYLLLAYSPSFTLVNRGVDLISTKFDQVMSIDMSRLVFLLFMMFGKTLYG